MDIYGGSIRQSRVECVYLCVYSLRIGFRCRFRQGLGQTLGI